MENFDLENLAWSQYYDNFDVSHAYAEKELAAYYFWCLGHNFDVVATILSMARLSWQKGFDAGLAIADFAEREPDMDSQKFWDNYPHSINPFVV